MEPREPCQALERGQFLGTRFLENEEVALTQSLSPEKEKGLPALPHSRAGDSLASLLSLPAHTLLPSPLLSSLLTSQASKCFQRLSWYKTLGEVPERLLLDDELPWAAGLVTTRGQWSPCLARTYMVCFGNQGWGCPPPAEGLEGLHGEGAWHSARQNGPSWLVRKRRRGFRVRRGEVCR